MKQLSSLLVPLACLLLIGLFQPAFALRKNTAAGSLYGALSQDAEPTYDIKTLVDAPASLEQEIVAPDEKTEQAHAALKNIPAETVAEPEKKPTDIAPVVEKQTDQTVEPQEEKVSSQPISEQKQKPTPIKPRLRPQAVTPQAPSLPTPVRHTATPLPDNNDRDELIEFQFEGTDLENLVKQVSILYDVIFIPDDSVSPLPQDSKSLKGNKVSFKTHKALTKGQAWDLFVTFLTLSGFTLVPDGHAHTYRITVIKKAQHEALPTFINIDYKDLPETDEMIRYVYFIENATIETIKGLVESFKSPDALVQVLSDAKAFVITDRSYNIKVLMNVIKELDKASMPQELMVIKLKQVDAQHVKELYDTLVQSQDDKGAYQRFFPPRKSPTSLYFPENVRIIAEKRTNTLIVLGPKDALKVLEEFIVKHIDVDLDQPYSKLTTHQLKYADAQTIADIMNDVTKIGASTDAGRVGGLRGSDRFLKPITFVADPSTNKLLIKGDYEDYLLVKPAIEALDIPQPQVAIEVLLLAVDTKNIKELGAQLRTKQPPYGLVGNNVKFQTSALGTGVVENTTETTGANRLLGDLINLVTGTSFGGPGKTVLTLGSDKYGVWGIFRALEQVSDAQLISNPFITTSNKTPAQVSVGEIRRIVQSQIINSVAGTPTNTYKDDPANLSVKITPQINSDGMISLQIEIVISDFTVNSTSINATKIERKIITNAIVANKEILALGGLLQNKSTNDSVKVPVLGDIPLLGYFFRDKSKTDEKSTLLVLISTQIINPSSQTSLNNLRQSRSEDITETLAEIDRQLNSAKDPIDKTFFSGRSQDPKDLFFSEYINRKFSVKEYQDLLKKPKSKAPKKEKKAKELSAKKKPSTKTNTIETETKQSPVGAQEAAS